MAYWMKENRVTRTVALLLAVALLHPISTEAASWRAGAAKTKITPTKPVWMAGYAKRDRPASGTLNELWAKALVIEDAQGKRALLLALDLVGIDRRLSQDICLTMTRRYGFDRSEITICTSHTHSGPVVGRNLAPLHYLVLDSSQQELIDDYATRLQERIATVVAKAIATLTPCELAWGTGRATFAVNRRNNAAQSVPAARVAGTIRGPHDHDVPVLALRAAEGRKLIALVFGYACHATVLDSYQWSGDYAGVAQQRLEAAHPGCTALFFAGCGADQNPLPRRTVALAEHYGDRLATAVEAVLLTTQMHPVGGRLQTNYREIELPFGRLPSAAEIQADANSDNRYARARSQLLKEQLEDRGELSASYPYPVSAWRLGDQIQFVFLGGEVVVDYALRLKLERAKTQTWVAGYANDVMAYIPSRRVLREGGYEGGGAMVYYGLPTSWAPEIEDQIVSTVHELLEE